jgi:RNA polymerase sigma factor (TIGR02999 family)
MSDKEPPTLTEQVFSEVYQQLRKIAAVRLANQSTDHTLQPTALVHDAWIQLSSHRARLWWGDTAKLCAAASTTMRRILIDRARLRAGVKRGGEWLRVPMDAANCTAVSADEKILLVHEALDDLEKRDPVHARVVALKFFAGLSNREVALEMSLTERTVERYWAHAKAWLYDEILLRR